MSASMKLENFVLAKFHEIPCFKDRNPYHLFIREGDCNFLFPNESESSSIAAVVRDPKWKCDPYLQQPTRGPGNGHAPYSFVPFPFQNSELLGRQSRATPFRNEVNDVATNCDNYSNVLLVTAVTLSLVSLENQVQDDDETSKIGVCEGGSSDRDDELLSERTVLEPRRVCDRRTSDLTLPENDHCHILSIFATEKFLSHYKFRKNETFYIKPVVTFPLSKVTIAAKTNAAYEWVTRNAFSASLVLSVCKGKVLCRKNDLFLASHTDLFEGGLEDSCSMVENLVTVDCEPVLQGHITVGTSIILTTFPDVIEEPVVQIPDAIRKSLKVSDRKTKTLMFSDFLGNLQDSMIFSRNPEETSLTLNPVIETCLLKKQTQENCDHLNLVKVSKSSMARLGLFHNSLVLVSCDDGGSSEADAAQTGRVARLNHATSEVDDGSVGLSPSLWFNLLKSPAILDPGNNASKVNIQKFTGIDLDEPDNSPSTSLSWSSGLPIAEEVHLALINSPNYTAAINMEKALKAFFMVERLICIGDVLAVNKGPTDICESDETEPVQFGMVYFKVASIDPVCSQCSTYVASFNCTTLYQSGVVQSYIPVPMELYYQPSQAMTYWNQFSPPGLDYSTSELVDVIEPYLFSRSTSCTLSPSILLIGPSGVGKTTIINAVARIFGLHLVKVNCHDLCGESSAATEARIKVALTKAESCTPCLLLLWNIHILGKERDGTQEDARAVGAFHNMLKTSTSKGDFPMIVIGTAPSMKQIGTEMADGFLHEFHMETPDEQERVNMLEGLVNDAVCGSDVNLAHVAQRSAGMVLGDLVSLLTNVKRQTYHRLNKSLSTVQLTIEEEEDLCLAGFSLLQTDFDAALDKLQAAHSDALGAPKIPNVTWDDVGGLSDIKSEILNTIQLPLQHPELFVAGLRRSGVLLFGPPGTGKTLLAKAVATECSLNFLSVKGPELINMYVGQSEENVREVFNRARGATPCVIFFDELDSLAPNRGRSGDSGGVMDRVVSQLLAELDGIVKSSDVFVIGATNRPDLLDPALLRPGRFDKLLYVGISEDKASQLNVLKALTRKFKLSKDCQLEAVVERCPPNMTGADFYALCSDAMLCAIKKKVQLLEQGKSVDEELLLDEDDFYEALSSLEPSVSMDELDRYKRIKRDLQSHGETNIQITPDTFTF